MVEIYYQLFQRRKYSVVPPYVQTVIFTKQVSQLTQ